MILRYTKLIGLPIFELREQTKLGAINDLLIDRSGQKISGFLLESPILSFKKPLIVLDLDVIEILKDVVLVKDEKSVIPISESLSAQELLRKRFVGINQRIESETGQYLGKAYDYLIDSKTLGVTKFYAKKVFKEIVVPSINIVEFLGHKIIVKDNLFAGLRSKELTKSTIVNEATA